MGSSAEEVVVLGGSGAVSLCNLHLSYIILGLNRRSLSQKLGTNEMERGST